ncbi:MAG: damage repair protein [Bacilli bacterium]|nr:damage repair protein [Bacilli bacterium]
MEKKKRTIAVIDLKAFYAYVECLDRGLDPWKAPLIVADKERGKNTIILSVSPYLKAHGVPSRLRVKELPKGFNYIYATPRMERYIRKSCEVVNVFMDFVAEEDIHVYSIDEAFLDLTSYLSYYKKNGIDMVRTIIQAVKDKTGLQATGGIGNNFFQAKVALDVYAKNSPEWIGTLYDEDVKTKLWPITPLIKIWGIGPHTEKKLNKMGIFNVEQLANADRLMMNKVFGIMGDQLVDQANGIDEADIHEIYVPKETSITFGQTLMRDYTKEEARLLIRELNDDLSMKLRGRNETTSVVSLAIIYSSNAGGFSRQLSLEKPSDDTDVLYDAFMTLYNKHCQDLPIRGVHIAYGHLRERSNVEQLDLFIDPEESEKKRNLQLMLDEIHNKYGKDIILRMSSLTDASTIKERHSFIGGHRK